MPGLRKNTLGKNKFFGYQKERIIKCQQASWPEDDVKPLRPFLIHLCEAPDFDKGQDCWPLHDSVFIPMCNKKYISKRENKENGSVSGKTDSLMSFFSAPRFSGWIPIWSVGALQVYLFTPVFKTMWEVPAKPTNFAWASKIGPGGPQCHLSFWRTGRRLWPA